MSDRNGNALKAASLAPKMNGRQIISTQETLSSQSDSHDLSLPDDRRALSPEIVLDSVSDHCIRAARFENSTDAVRRSTYHFTPQISEPEGSVSPP